MPCLRMRYHAAPVYLGDETIKGKALVRGHSCCGKTYRRLLLCPLLGFTDQKNIGQTVKLMSINGYTTEPFKEPWLEYGANGKLLGRFVHVKGAYCYLEDMKPVVWCDWPYKD